MSREYIPELERARALRDKSLQDAKDDSMNRLMKDLAVDREKNPSAAFLDRWDPDEEDNEDEDDGDINIIDRSKSSNRLVEDDMPPVLQPSNLRTDRL
jgi:hypothetical protein